MGDPGMAYLNGLIDDMFMADVRRYAHECRRYRDDEAPMDEALESQSSAAGGLAQDRYESRLIEEARAIAAGTSTVQPTAEHVRVLVGRLPIVIADGLPF
jgi:hypothetical protein